MLIARPSIARVDGNDILIGQPFVVWATRDSAVISARGDSTGLRLAGLRKAFSRSPSLIDSPIGVALMEYPTAVSVGNAMEVFWGRRTDTTRRDRGFADSLMESRLDARGWASPRAIATGAVFDWEPRTRSAVVRNGALTVVATSAYDPRTNWMGVVVIRVDASPNAVRLTDDSKPQYLTMAGDGSRNLVLVYTVSVRTSDSTTVYSFVSRRSSDNGATWTRAIVIGPAPQGNDWPKLAWLSDGPHLIWLERAGARAAEPLSSRVRHYLLRREGWSELSAMLIPGRPESYSAALDGEGRLHVVTQSRSGEIKSATWRGSGWTPAEDVPLPPSLSGPTLLPLGRDSIVILGLFARPSIGSPPLGGPVQLMVVKPGSCR